MKKLFTLFFFLTLVILSCYAQPSVDDIIIPNFQDSIHLIKCASTDFQASTTGENQTWDFSNLQPDATNPEYYFKFFDPQDAPHFDRYPQADIAAINADSQWVYYNYENNNLMELIGAVFDDPNFGIAYGDYSNFETEEKFPIQYENGWTDAFDGTNVFGAFSTAFSGTVEGEVDGYGTLILPSGTFENVLRIKENRTYTIPGTPTMTSTMYRYVSSDYNLWLLSMESFPTNPPLIYYQDNPEIISATNDIDYSFDLKIAPNPIQRGTDLQLQMSHHDFISIELFDLFGKRITTKRSEGSTANLTIPNSLHPGIYFIHGILIDGFFSKKIIVTD
ncbi:MAG: T9SS type A sorting domain-containing protein [Saprospiraceae bacterium]